jgi:hypothetical protein
VCVKWFLLMVVYGTEGNDGCVWLYCLMVVSGTDGTDWLCMVV